MQTTYKKKTKPEGQGWGKDKEGKGTRPRPASGWAHTGRAALWDEAVHLKPTERY